MPRSPRSCPDKNTCKSLAVPCLLLLLITGCAWPTYRQNQYRSGRSSIDTSSNTGTLQWSHNFGPGPLYSTAGPLVGIASPTLGGIYVGDSAGNLYSFTPAGTIAWTLGLPTTNGAIPSAMGLDGTVYVADAFGSLYAVSSSGTLKWNFSPPGGLSQSAELATSTNCTAAAGCETTIYTGTQCGVVYALNSGGSVKWTFGAFQGDCSQLTPTISPAIAADGTIYSGVYSPQGTGVLFALNSDGTLRWSSNAYAGTPAIDPNSGIIYVVSLDMQHLYALNSGGFLQWQLDAPHSFTLPAIASDGTLYMGTFGSGLWAVNPNGTIKWQTSPGGQSDFDAPPTIGGDGTIYVAYGSLYAVNPNSTLKWSTPLCGGAGADLGVDEPVIGSDGTIYLRGEGALNGAGYCPLEAFQ